MLIPLLRTKLTIGLNIFHQPSIRLLKNLMAGERKFVNKEHELGYRCVPDENKMGGYLGVLDELIDALDDPNDLLTVFSGLRNNGFNNIEHEKVKAKLILEGKQAEVLALENRPELKGLTHHFIGDLDSRRLGKTRPDFHRTAGPRAGKDFLPGQGLHRIDGRRNQKADRIEKRRNRLTVRSASLSFLLDDRTGLEFVGCFIKLDLGSRWNTMGQYSSRSTGQMGFRQYQTCQLLSGESFATMLLPDQAFSDAVLESEKNQYPQAFVQGLQGFLIL